MIEKITLEAFSQQPFEEVNVGAIIKTCGISRGSFYQYFADKVDLFEYLLKQNRLDTLLILSNAMENEQLPFLVRLKRFFIADSEEVLSTEHSAIL